MVNFKVLARIILSAISFMVAPGVSMANPKDNSYVIKSPDGSIEVDIFVGKKIFYSVQKNKKVLLEPSEIALALNDRVLGNSAKVSKIEEESRIEKIESPFYRFSSFVVRYNELNIFCDGFRLVFRIYNEGVAYRFVTNLGKSITIKDEIAKMNFPGNHKTYMAYSSVKRGRDKYAMAFQNTYTEAPISKADTGNIAFLPITVEREDGIKMTLLESDLEEYPGMFIKGESEKSLMATFARFPSQMAKRPPRAMTYIEKREDFIARTTGNRAFPWRIWAITMDDREMPVNNLVYALASPNRIKDISWIKTGKVAWDWWNNWGVYNIDFKAGINTKTYKHYIDFAAENKIEFVVLDEGWYDTKNGDMLHVVADINLQELIDYGKSKNVQLILWTVFNVLDEQLEAACKKYADMGISGFKVDFLDRDDQTAVEMGYRLAETAARYKLTLDYHGFYKPTGINRTYPNIINIESVFGMEEMKWSTVEKDMMQYDVTMPFIRMMSGLVDYTPGAMRNATKANFKPIYNNPFSQGTRCHQLAAYIIHDSPLTMLADNPTIYKKEQECTDFICRIPNSGIDETKILDGKLGAYIVTARRIGPNWYLGAMTNWDPRSVTLKFDFLSKGKYKVTLFKDGINADQQAEDYLKETFEVTRDSVKEIYMAPGGGCAMTIEKI